MLLFSASIAACESEKILIYCMLLCFVSMNLLQASFVAMISAWKTVVSIGSRILSVIISLCLYCMVYPEPACSSVKLPSV